ncbi:MAG: hypothetical protein P8P30_02895 [Rickettsiales bacterium]|nr:hypothetical protein [Rickettsiales bacterium]
MHLEGLFGENSNPKEVAQKQATILRKLATIVAKLKTNCQDSDILEPLMNLKTNLIIASSQSQRLATKDNISGDPKLISELAGAIGQVATLQRLGLAFKGAPAQINHAQEAFEALTLTWKELGIESGATPDTSISFDDILDQVLHTSGTLGLGNEKDIISSTYKRNIPGYQQGGNIR